MFYTFFKGSISLWCDNMEKTTNKALKSRLRKKKWLIEAFNHENTCLSLFFLDTGRFKTGKADGILRTSFYHWLAIFLVWATCFCCEIRVVVVGWRGTSCCCELLDECRWSSEKRSGSGSLSVFQRFSSPLWDTFKALNWTLTHTVKASGAVRCWQAFKPLLITACC